MGNYKMIDYDHAQGGCPCNGNLSNVDVRFEAHWTYEGHGGTTTQARPLTPEGFALLWDGIAASVSEAGVFWRGLVTDPTRVVDPSFHHVITATQVRDGWVRHRTFMVPSSEADPAFVAWLDALAVPGSVGCGGSKPARRGQAAVMAGHAEAGAKRSRVPA